MTNDLPSAIFARVARRLCYIRRRADEAELEIPLDADGFLAPPIRHTAAQSEFSAGALVDPADVMEAGVLVLLGEPGVGKTTTFRSLVHENDPDVIWIDGAELTQSTVEERLGRHLQSVSDVSRRRDSTLVVVLDQLDESPMVRSLARYLRQQLVNADVPRLKLLLGCRSADYPAALTDALASSGMQVFLADLAPLTREQAEDLANSVQGVDGLALIDAAVEAGAGALASVPLTLSMLTRTYLLQGDLERDPRALFASGVLQLADEPNDVRRGDFQTTADQRVAVAARAAARLLLTGRRTLWRGAQLQAGPLDLRIESLVGGTEPLPNGANVDVSRSVVSDALSTALFTGRGENRLAFRHSSIAAYLAAAHIVSRRVPQPQLKTLFLVDAPEGSQTIPTLLREPAAWLITLDPDHATWVVEADPQSLAAHSRIVDSNQTRALIVESLLKRAGEVELSDVPWARSPRRLAHDGLADQLRVVLREAGDEEPPDWSATARVRLAVHLAREAVVPGLAEELLHIVESDGWSAHIRELAALAAFETEESAVAPRLRAVLDRLTDVAYTTAVDPDDELRGTLLSLLWPTHVGVDSVLPHLRPRRNRNLVGMYLRFEHRFPSQLAESDLPAVLAWARSVIETEAPKSDAVSDDPHGRESERAEHAAGMDDELLDALVERAASGPNAVSRMTDVAAVVLPRLKRYDRVPLPAALDLVDADGHEPQHVRDLRQTLAGELLKHVAADGEGGRADAWIIVDYWSARTALWRAEDTAIPENLRTGGRQRLLGPEDFGWAYAEAGRAKAQGDTSLSERFAELATMLFDARNPSVVDLAYGDHDHPVWDQLRHWFDPIEIDSDQADRLRKLHRRAHAEDDASHPEAFEFAEEQRRRLLDASEGESDAFWRLLWNLQFPPDTLRGHVRLDDDVAAFPGMAVFTDIDDAISRLIGASAQYLANEDDHRGEWLGTNRYDKRAWAGYLALALLRRHEELSRIPDAVWRAWVGALVWFSAVPVNAGDEELKADLLERAAQNAPSELALAASRYLRGELAQGGLASEIRSIKPAWAPALVETWRQLVNEIATALTTSAASPDPDADRGVPQAVWVPDTEEAKSRAVSLWEEMLEALLQVDQNSEDIARGQLSRAAIDKNVLELRVRAALVLLRHDAPRWWREVYGLAGRDAEFGHDLALAAARSRNYKPMLDDLPEEGLADVYRWLSGLFPPGEDPEYDEVHFVSPEEEARQWRDRILQQLAERAADTQQAVLELAQLADEYPDRLIVRANLVRAKGIAGEADWQPPHPDELAQLLDDARRRLVRSDAELSNVLVDTLQAVEAAVEQHGDLLWDKVPARLAPGDSPVWLPKPEAALAAYLTHELRQRLAGRQVVVNREVLVRPTDEYGAGDRTDILVEAVAPHGVSPSLRSGHASVVIELKGAWNREVRTAQRSQLAAQYLSAADTNHGLYVVVWFPLDLWTDTDDHRRPRVSAMDTEELLDHLSAQAGEIAADLGCVTRPLLLNFPRSHPTTTSTATDGRVLAAPIDRDIAG